MGEEELEKKWVSNKGNLLFHYSLNLIKKKLLLNNLLFSMLFDQKSDFKDCFEKKSKLNGQTTYCLKNKFCGSCKR